MTRKDTALDQFASLHEGISKMDDVGEATATYLRGVYVHLRASTNDAGIHAKLDQAIAGIDTSVKAIFANTRAASDNNSSPYYQGLLARDKEIEDAKKPKDSPKSKKG